MQIKEFMTNDVNLIGPTTMINEASRIMKEDDIGVLPVRNDDRLVGMVTDRDIVVKALAEGKNPALTPVSEIMSDQVLYCFEDQAAEEVASNMGQNKIRRLPVLNKEKRLVGIVSLGDLSVNGSARHAGDALEKISQQV